VGDEVAPFGAARQTAELERNAFTSPRSFGCGCATLRILADSSNDLSSVSVGAISKSVEAALAQKRRASQNGEVGQNDPKTSFPNAVQICNDSSTSRSRKKLLVLDLDETLIYAAMFRLDQRPDFHIGLANVLKRPGAEQFLSSCLGLFDMGVWTSATPEYANEALNHLLGKDFARLAFIRVREHCSKVFDPVTEDQYWHKDLGRLLNDGYDVRDIIVADDTPRSWTPYDDNVVPVTRYTGDPYDVELSLLLPFLVRLSCAEDVRSVDKRHWRSIVWRAYFPARHSRNQSCLTLKDAVHSPVDQKSLRRRAGKYPLRLRPPKNLPVQSH